MLSDEIKNRQPTATAIMACRECSCGYGYAGARIVLTLSIFRVSSKPGDCLSEPIEWLCILFRLLHSTHSLAGKSHFGSAKTTIETGSRILSTNFFHQDLEHVDNIVCQEYRIIKCKTKHKILKKLSNEYKKSYGKEDDRLL